MSSDIEGAEGIEALEACVERLTPLTPFFGRVAARIPAAEAAGLRFWLLTFAEHGVFIAGNLPCDRQDLIAEAKRFSDFFYALLNRPGPVRTEACLPEAVQGAQAMLGFLERLMDMEVAGDLASALPPSTYLHMVKETRRFILIATQPDKCIEPLGAGAPRTPLVNLLDAEYFWLDDQSGHSQMLQQAVDPVQIRYMEEARNWEGLLRHLASEGHNLKKMAEAIPPRMPVAGRSTRDAVGATVGARDFAWDTFELRNTNQLLGNQPALLASEGHNLKKMAEAMPPRMPVAARSTRDAVGATVGARDFAWDTFELRNTNQLLGNQPALLAYHMARESEHARLVMEALAGGYL